jgi:hypothetical protein
MLSALLLFMIEPVGFRDSDPMLPIRFCVVYGIDLRGTVKEQIPK